MTLVPVRDCYVDSVYFKAGEPVEVEKSALKNRADNGTIPHHFVTQQKFNEYASKASGQKGSLRFFDRVSELAREDREKK
jgi:hypothetical protein